MSTNNALSQKQQRFVAALLLEPSTRKAAAIAGVSDATAWRWLRDTNVRREAGRVQDAMLGQATRQAVNHMGEALAVLAGIMGDVTAPAGARVSAARAILESGLRFAELVSLAERVTLLEEMAVK